MACEERDVSRGTFATPADVELDSSVSRETVQIKLADRKLRIAILISVLNFDIIDDVKLLAIRLLATAHQWVASHHFLLAWIILEMKQARRFLDGGQMKDAAKLARPVLTVH
ncbi:hypothetical protein ACIQUP_21660 [Streptomyces nigra]|uniref:hypothetical protein n=1 Tax=Streptomyces nigra TaxID=1827580 RepID=UPI0037FB5BC7